MKNLTILLLALLIFANTVFAQTVETVVEPFIVNEISDSTNNFMPSIAALSNGKFIISWIDIDDSTIIKIQQYDSTAQKLKGLRIWEKLSEDHRLLKPTIFINESKSFIIVTWNDQELSYTSGYTRVFSIKYDFNLSIKSSTKQINQHGYNYCDTKMFFDNESIATFWDCYADNGSFEQYSQKTDNSLNPIGSETRYNTNFGYLNSCIDVDIIDDEQFLLASSTDNNDGGVSIYAVNYSFYNESNNQKWTLYDFQDPNFADDIKVSVLDSSSYIIAFSETKYASPYVSGIIIKKLSSDGTILNELHIEDENNITKSGWSDGPNTQLYLFKKENKEHLLIYQTELEIKGISLDENLEILSEYELHKFSQNNSEKHFNYFIKDSLLYITWSSKKDDSRYNIWAKVLRLDGSVGVEGTTELPENYSLLQNYPNPFNPSTVIKYNIPNIEMFRGTSLQKVTLKVYDILGKEVATLVNKEQSAGSYEVEFNASASSATPNKLSSGVYFYTLRVGSSTGSATSSVETKKMLLIR